ncbi:hypothetical protein ACFSC9_02350 [Paenibacillus wenxiniae]|uniref:Uncharacterized protein n=1 Tax=Paenibacillus wenxiniae TaxID=1636843 RepID=A0ABW4RDL5_9BACL
MTLYGVSHDPEKIHQTAQSEQVAVLMDNPIRFALFGLRMALYLSFYFTYMLLSFV